MTFTDSVAAATDKPAKILALNAAIAKLAAIDERKSRIVELMFFGGLTTEEIAAVLDALSLRQLTNERNLWANRRRHRRPVSRTRIENLRTDRTGERRSRLRSR